MQTERRCHSCGRDTFEAECHYCGFDHETGTYYPNDEPEDYPECPGCGNINNGHSCTNCDYYQ